MADFLLELLALERWKRIINRAIAKTVRELIKADGQAAKSAVLATVLKRRNKYGRTDQEVTEMVDAWFERARFGFGGRFKK